MLLEDALQVAPERLRLSRQRPVFRVLAAADGRNLAEAAKAAAE